MTLLMVTEVCMKRAVLGLAAVGLALGGAVAAVASPAEGGIPQLESSGVEFSGGHYKLNRPGVNHGAFEWRGRLTDTLVADRHNVYVDVQVQGHDWVRYYGKQRSSVLLRQSNWNGAQRYIGEAKLRVCRDRGSLHPDNCAPLQTFSHDWDRG
ncbi:hypothetical protein ACFWBB_07565 [Streptomyces sp. NPDC060000]|uniref:hypothetical protein n=1 Tax=Streptomyces sp. NPDC060000 TaxID=3347031 RepID=UPI0036A9FB0B